MNSSLLLSWVTFGYFFSALFYLIALVFKKEGVGRIAGWIIRIVFYHPDRGHYHALD